MKLNEKLARWAEIDLSHDWDNDITGYQITGSYCTRCERADISVEEDELCIPDFTTDLNACFKWLFKPLCDYFINKSTIHERFQQDLYEFLQMVLREVIYNSEYHTIPNVANAFALALCKAIEQLIDKESNES